MKKQDQQHGKLVFMVFAVVAALWAPGVQAEEEPQQVRMIEFGNSLLENSVPWFLPGMAKAAGQDLKIDAAIQAAFNIWMHADKLRKGEAPQAALLLKSETDWNALLLQPFDGIAGLKPDVRSDMFGKKVVFDKPRDISDPTAAGEIIDLFLARAKEPAKARVFIYSSWPGMPGASEMVKRVKDEMMKSLASASESREEILKKVNQRKLTAEEMGALVKEFDFGSLWLAEYKPVEGEKSWQSTGAHSRDYITRLMELLRRKYPELARENRLCLIPGPEVFLALDRKARAGGFPGIDNVGRYYVDGLHVRCGLPRYTLAATIYAVVFGRNPGELDYAIYNNKENYSTEKVKPNYPWAYIHLPELGDILEITPERAKVVNETIWEVVTTNPYAGLAKTGTKQEIAKENKQ